MLRDTANQFPGANEYIRARYQLDGNVEYQVTRHFSVFFGGRNNAMEDEPIVNLVPNADAARWLEANVPLFACPDADVEEIYFFRWWALRKHLRRAPDGSRVFTEFINRADPVSSALGHHLMEGRWLHDRAWHDDYVYWWLRSNGGRPHVRLHAYSQWLADALYQRFKVTHDRAFVVALIDDLVADYRQWEIEKGVSGTGIPGIATAPGRSLEEATGGGRGPAEVTALFRQYDVRDAMEESISGSRTKKNIRPTINSYMYGNARAIAEIARLAYHGRTLTILWDRDGKDFRRGAGLQILIDGKAAARAVGLQRLTAELK